LKQTTESRRTLAELAAESGLPARTIRFYIARGLLPRPEGGGRGAGYGKQHLMRLEEIKKMQARGMMLAEIARRLAGERPADALPAPSPWWSYPIEGDVVVWVRADASPWRLRQIRSAIEQAAALLRKDGDNDGN
jgi:DNA-binding transcriptional MerR regulator